MESHQKDAVRYYDPNFVTLSVKYMVQLLLWDFFGELGHMRFGPLLLFSHSYLYISN